MMKKVLFVCADNTARSQIAQAYLNKLAKGRFKAQSAGFNPGILNEYAIIVMREDNIDISDNTTQSVLELYLNRKRFDYVITLCSSENEADCPAFLGVKRRLHWDIPDLARHMLSDEQMLRHMRMLRDEIKARVIKFISGDMSSTDR